MTRQYLGHWLDGANHYRMQVLGDAADNPDQRIAEDINLFVERGLYIGIRLLGAVVTLVSFVAILWSLSDDAPLNLFGYEVAIPGYLLWAALVYAIIGTVLTHLVGGALVGLNFRQQRFEADFRFNLVRARESSEQIALLGGEGAETHRLLQSFRQRDPELEGNHAANQEAHLPHRRIPAGGRDLSFPGRQSRLFRRACSARGNDADRLRVRQRAGIPVDHHHGLSGSGGVAGGGGAPRRI